MSEAKPIPVYQTVEEVKKAVSEALAEHLGEQTPDTPDKDENGDGVKGGQTTADNHGDILGI